MKNNTTHTADYMAGISDCKAGFYDKWYRNYRNDGGADYNAGWMTQNLITRNDVVEFIG